MPVNIRQREGFALATAIVAIVLIGLLIAASFFGAFQEYRTGRNTLYQERALSAAEYGLGQVLARFDKDVARAMAFGEVETRTMNVPDGATASIDLTRLNLLTFSVVSEGHAAAGTDMEARRRAGMLIRLEIPELPIKGAVTTSGPTTVTGNQTTSGQDTNPTGWTCDPAGPPRAGYVNDNSADVAATGNCSGQSCITGTPKVAADPIAGDPDTYDQFGGISFDSLALIANHTIVVASTPTFSQVQPSYTGGDCNRNDVKNWGDFNRNAVTPGACESFFPIIYMKGTGTVTLKQGSGQGLLLVEGNLVMEGQFTFYGVIIVKGTVETTGNGNKVVGGIMAANEGCTSACNRLAGTSTLQFSRCAILSTLVAHARPVLATRAWSDMF